MFALHSAPTILTRRLARWQWQVPLFVVCTLALLELIEHAWLEQFPPAVHEFGERILLGFEVISYAVFFPLILWWGIAFLRRSVEETEQAKEALQRSHVSLQNVNQRLEFLIQVNHRLATVVDEETLLEEITQLSLEVSEEMGCMTLFFDERGKPSKSHSRGEVDRTILDAWESHLAVHSEQGHYCAHCQMRSATSAESCPLLQFRLPNKSTKKIYCMNLQRGTHIYGVITLFLKDELHPTAKVLALLDSMVAEMSLVLEAYRLRSREMKTLYHLQQSRQLQNLNEELAEVLEHLADALEIKGAGVFLAGQDSAEFQLVAETGKPLGTKIGLVSGLANTAQNAETPFVVSDLDLYSEGGQSTLLIAPICLDKNALGCLVLWDEKAQPFSRRHFRISAMVAGQLAFLVENHRLYARAEYQAALAERSRLAREIHDGLAQTLGYLKLRAAQIDRWMEDGDHPRVKIGFGKLRALIGEAYLDTREAIDGLRIQAGNRANQDWLRQIVDEFQSLSNIPVSLDATPSILLPPEVQGQLQRIIQESLSNIRKHAQASAVQIQWQCEPTCLSVCISDNGQGFDPEDVPVSARHGLRIMRERAELLGAMFDLQSQWEHGTHVTITLPLRYLESIHG